MAANRAKASYGGELGVIDNFVSEYEREYDFWDAAARTARTLIETELKSSGLRAIVTSRAKSVDRLSEKLRQRDRERRYKNTAHIREDIADLAGVRVALYFPGQMDEAEQLIRATLEVVEAKTFPPDPKTPIRGGGGSESNAAVRSTIDSSPAVSRRFSGYGARHLCARIPEKSLSDAAARYATATVEVQVASVLMHAWSEVEHDLVYKPLEGELSPSEYALLDQLNGLVLAGEIALEQLQKAGDERVAAAATPFRDHFELGEFLRARLVPLGRELTDATLGRVDILFGFLAEQGVATAKNITPYLEELEQDFERRPVAEQLADLMLSGDPGRYTAYRKATSRTRHPSGRGQADNVPNPSAATQQDIGAFITEWILFEELLANLLPDERRAPMSSTLRRALATDLLTEPEYARLNALRDLRNKLVHRPSGELAAAQVKAGTRQLREVASALRKRKPPPTR